MSFLFIPPDLSKRVFKHLRVIIVFAGVAWLGGCALASKHTTQTLLNNVSYASVLDLAVDKPSEIIAYGEADTQQIWYYEANANLDFKGVVVLIHGGCWLSQFTIEHTQALSNALSDEGYAVWNVEYRSTGNGGEWPVALDDIRSAIKQLTIQKSHVLDLSKVNFVGHSAGGHLAMLATATPESLGLLEQTKVKTIGLAPIVDIQAYSLGTNSCQTATPQFMQGSGVERPSEYWQASVLNYRFEPALTYVMVGGNDKLVPAEFSEHPDAQQIMVADAGHFDWIHPDTTAFKQLLDVLNK